MVPIGNERRNMGQRATVPAPVPLKNKPGHRNENNSVHHVKLRVY